MAKRASSAARGYGPAHQRERAKWKTIVDTGQASCCLCGKQLQPGQPFDLDHTPDKSAYRGPACVSCNRSDGAARGNRARGVLKRTMRRNVVL